VGYNFETFDRRAGRLVKAPEVTVQSSGTLSLNASAANLLGNAEAIGLLYDRTNNVVGVRPVPPETPHAYPLRPVTGERSTFVINARSFFLYYDLPIGTAVRRDVRADDGVLILDLNDPGRVAVSNRKRSKRVNGVDNSAAPETSSKLAEESSR
jgi:hypothetical protein